MENKSGIRGSPCSPPSACYDCAFPTRVVPPIVQGRVGVTEAHERQDVTSPWHGRQPSPAQDVIVMPSTLRMVASGSESVAARSMCPTQSVPARVDNAHWNGAHSASNSEANCFARVLATSRQRTSSCNAPHTPIGLLKCCESSSHEP